MNIAIINQNGGKYLFEVPDSITLKEGEKVKCDTRRGVTDGIVWADSIAADEPAAKLIGKLLGARFPLKTVVGKTVTSVEMFEQPEQPKQEPVKLYCVKDYKPGCWCTKGKVYEVDTVGSVVHDDGYKERDFMRFMKRGGKISDNSGPWSGYLVPLVSRPAEVGEWVYVTSDKVDGVTRGEVCEVIKLNDNYKYLRTKAKTNYGWPEIQPCTLICDTNYLVLDGYKPEPEKAEPEYYSGKVVCVEATDISVTLGKVYTVENGVFTWNSGTRFATKASTIEQLNNWFVAAKFIEFKGE